MRLFPCILLALTAAAGVSCIKEAASDPVPSRQVTIRVSIPAQSKVSLTTTSDRQKLCLAWKDGDVLSVNGAEFPVSNILNEHEAEFSGTDPGAGPYTIIYPGKYASADAFYARSYASQTQSGNSSTDKLEYNAMLLGVSECLEPKFDPDWAAAKGGSLIQNGAIQLRLQLPAGVTSATRVALIASRPVFPVTNDNSEMTATQILSLDGCALQDNRILEAYMLFSAAGVEFQSGDQLTVAVDTPDAMYCRTLDMGVQSWVGGGEYTIQCKVSTPNNISIGSVADLEAFRDGVNNGDFRYQWAHVTLTTDLDCSGLSSWTPIGAGTFISDDTAENKYEVSGTPFRGTFDGASHKLKNLRLSGTPAENAPFGLFGILDGATVRDLTFGAASADGGAFEVTPSATMQAGIVAGVARGSVLRNITNYCPLTIKENSSAAPAFFGMVGYLMGTSAAGGTTLENVDNYGAVSAHGGSNTNNGGTGFNVGAVVGFSYTNNSNVSNHIDGCDNYGAVTTSTGRAAGILGAANARTILIGCTNRGNVSSSFSTARIGGICSLLGNTSWMYECSNYGTVATSASGGQGGGLACLVNHAAVEIIGGGNHGLILTNATTYKGTIVANLSDFKAISDVVAGGAIATYSADAPNHIGSYTIITEANYLNYLGGGLNAEKLARIKDTSYEAWNSYPDGSITYISDADELLAFAAAVNNGTFRATDMAVLTADIDCSSIDDWAPIGTCSMSSNWSHVNLETNDSLFAGTFDGQGHTISNLEMYFSSSGSFKAYGFFGGLADDAVVKNLIFDDSCLMNVSASYGGCFGVLAGLVKGATVENIENHATVTGGGLSSLANNTAAGRMMVGGIIGEVHAGASVAAKLSKLHNFADIGSSARDFSCGGNKGNGANGVHVGGIAGFSTNTNNTRLVTFTDCINDGNIYTNAGRSSGMIAACNRYTKLVDCINNGDMVSSVNGSFRLGNITCIGGVGSVFERCINYGNLTALNSVSVAGIICLVNDDNVTLTDCASLGATILGKNVNVSGSQTYNGVLFGQCNKAASFSGCRVSGVFGSSDTNQVVLTAENYFQYVGQYGSTATSCTTENITFAGGSASGNGIANAEDLLAFAAAFNADGDVSRFLVGGKVTLTDDINASSISAWTPIGTADRPLNIDFDGNGKTISHVKWTVNVSQSLGLGLIGCASGITVSNLTLGGEDSSITFTGNRSQIRAGGIVGRAENVTFTGVVNNAALKVTGTSATGNNLMLGGIAGYADGDCTVGGSSEAGCVNNGSVSASVAGYLGGLVGYNAGVISYCTNRADITCPASGNYGPAWLCAHNGSKKKLTANSGYGLVNGQPALIRNAVKEDYENMLDPESVTVDWTLDAYYDWTVSETRNLHSGATYTRYSCTNVPREIFVLEVDLTDPGIEITSALAGDMIPNPNGLPDNDHNYMLNTIRERLSDVCTRRRAEGQNILAGVNAGFFDTSAGILRGPHVENGEPLYINNPDAVMKLPNHKWSFTVFKDGTVSCGVKQFRGKMRTAGKEFEYYSINDTILRRTSADYQANLYTSRFKKQPYADHPELVNPLAEDALYVICQWDNAPMTVNTGYAWATVTEVRDGRSASITPPQLTGSDKFVIALSGEMARKWSSFVQPGLKVELNCTITVDGVSKPILTQVSTMYQLMTDGRDASNTPGSSASLYSAYDPMTYPVVSKDGRKVWLVQIDGRQNWYSMGVKGYEMYRIAKKLGGWWATRLDGGGSSCTWLWNGSSGGIVSRPFDNPGGERSCMNYLLVRTK